MVFSSKYLINQLNRYYPPVILLFLVIIGYWQVALWHHPLKWDLMDQAYPWKYFIGECLQNNTLPLWNPYQHCGYPIHADPQSSAWYPIVWFFGFVFGYDIYIISIDFVLHIFLAGLGMFFLGRVLKLSKNTSLLMGISYMFCGFFVGNAQHFMWIISGTWLPYVIGTYLKLTNDLNVKSAIIFSLAMVMLLTGGYPAFTMMVFYLLGFIFIYEVSTSLLIKNKKVTLAILRVNLIALSLTITNGMVVILSTIKLIPYMPRAEGITLPQANFGAFTIESFISFILPYGAVSTDWSYFKTDLSMTNIYFGLVLLVFLVAGLVIKKTGIVKVFLGWGIFMLAAALGDLLPVREFLFNYMPFFNLFRFPSMLRIFVIISFIIVSGYTIEQFRLQKIKGQTVKISIVILILTLLMMTGIKIYGQYLDLGAFISGGHIFSFSKSSTIAQQIFLQSIISFIILTLIYFLFIKLKKSKTLVIGILILASLDLIFATQLNGPYTIYSANISQKGIKAYSKTFPHVFPVPEVKSVNTYNDQNYYSHPPLWKNLNIFYKNPAFDGYNPLHLKNFEFVEDSLPNLLNTCIENPVIYFSEIILLEDSMQHHNDINDVPKKPAYLNNINYLKFKDITKSDNHRNRFNLIKFNPNQIVIQTNTIDETLLVLLQNRYYGWKVFINDVESEVLDSNKSFMGVKSPPGSNTIEFVYQPTMILIGFYISVISIFSCLIWLVVIRFKTKNLSE